MRSTKKLRHWEVVSSLNQCSVTWSAKLIPWLPKLGWLPFKGDTKLNTNVNNIPKEDQHMKMRSFLFLCTIWKLAYISAATSPSRISLSLQLTISSPKVTLFVGWRGVPPPLPCHKTQRKAPNRQNSLLPVKNYFSMIFLQTSRVKNQNQHRETYKNMRDAFFLN